VRTSFPLWAAVVLAVPVTVVAMRVLGVLYRLTVEELMVAPGRTVGPHDGADGPLLAAREPRSGSIHQNIRGRRELAGTILLACVAIGFTSAALTHPTALSDLRTTRGRTGAVLALLYFGLRDSWVAVPALGLLARWSWVRTIGLAALYLSCMAGLFWLVSRGGTTAWANLVRGPGQLLLYIVLIANRRFRGIGPYLLPTCVPAVWVLCEVFLRVGTAAANLPVELIVLTIAVLFLLAAGASVLVGTALSLAFIRLLSRAYAAGAFSDLLYLIGVYWLLALSFDAFAFESWAVMLAIVWLPIVFWSFRGRLRPPPDPPNLLVLRVFRDEHAISALFDSVVDRWRNSGTVYLLAGPDLLLRTLDPQRLFAYVGRRLRRYVISDEAVLATRLADLHERPDPDGRFRVFEFLCVEGAWQPTVDQLLRRADNVLMDLRGLRASNSGSLHELGAIARADHVNRAVLLIDGATDLAAAYDALGTRPPWIVWLESARLDRCEVDGVLELLLHPRVSPRRSGHCLQRSLRLPKNVLARGVLGCPPRRGCRVGSRAVCSTGW